MALLPGLALCAAVTLASVGIGALEKSLFGRAWLEDLVIAILLGTFVQTLRPLPAGFQPGIHFSAKILLEIAVVLLGASVSASALLANGVKLIAGIAGVVVIAIVLSYALGRAMGLPSKMAILIACGNSICGNSAIAAVAPVIDADSGDVTSAIAFTAILGVIVVLGLPLVSMLLALTPSQFGVFAGLTVYAVPQVIAASSPVSVISVHVGTLVKLIRVLMLGPVVLVLSLLKKEASDHKLSLSHLVPWFIVGFLLMLAARSAGLIPATFVAATEDVATSLTIMSMAALGLGVNARALLQIGPRVAAVVVLSLAALAVISLALIHLLAL
jgi:uncharacterized integral membrane protein (TIGR00698 family)